MHTTIYIVKVRHPGRHRNDLYNLNSESETSKTDIFNRNDHLSNSVQNLRHVAPVRQEAKGRRVSQLQKR